MSDLNKSYRIRTDIGELNADNIVPVVNVQLNQTYDMLEILSLKLTAKDAYKYYESSYGVVVGRVVANGGFGVPNAKISIFVEGGLDGPMRERVLYGYDSPQSHGVDGVRYNLLPDEVDDACHATVGTFPNKRLLLDNNDIIEVFDKYWRYTTVTNDAGDYMLFGVPTGNQRLHVDIDLSDCGMLSQRPRDLIAKGYNANLFDSPNKFKKSKDLDSLAQLYKQDKGVYVYPYWGEEGEKSEMLSITRCDINIEYKFEPYAVFIGSMITDKGGNAIGKECTATDTLGNMSDLSAGEGKIEMIRKTQSGYVEQYQIKGDRLIDGDGVWCYTIPMNLDYVRTDEFGNLVPTDDPSKGIPTRARVRFRFTLDEMPTDASAKKRCRYLVPNNPRYDPERYPNFCETKEADYAFGTDTQEESYCDLFWNKVYTVKNYIPRLQKNGKPNNKQHTGIKLINHYGDNNPMPYNNLRVNLSFTFRLICVIVKVIVYIIESINFVLGAVGTPFCALKKALKTIGKAFSFKILGVCPLCPIRKLLIDPLVALCDGMIIKCISLSNEFCNDGINPNIYYPGCGSGLGKIFSWCVWDGKTYPDCVKEQKNKAPEDQLYCTNNTGALFTCIENELAQNNDATSFCFYNDWVNGTLYAPMWYRKLKPKKKYLFGLIKRKAKDDWCDANRRYSSMRVYHPCAVDMDKDKIVRNTHNEQVDTYKMNEGGCKDKCHEQKSELKDMHGLIVTRETLIGQTVYYYKAVEYTEDLKNEENKDSDHGVVRLLFATDIVLLGSLNDYDVDGIPQFFKNLESTTYNMPTDILFTENEFQYEFDKDTGEVKQQTMTSATEMSGCDWGNENEFGKKDGGLFYSIGCSTIEMMPKSCINLQRICEFGVSLDESKNIPNITLLSNGDQGGSDDNLIADGYVSFDELYNIDGRAMFATLNGNGLRTKLNPTNGLRCYDFRHLYPNNFDGSLKKVMEKRTKNYDEDVNYKNNHRLESFNRDYFLFRMGNKPFIYTTVDGKNRFPRFENSFYFYFGLKQGKTAIEKFNSQYFADCENIEGSSFQVSVVTEANDWCSEVDYIENTSGFVTDGSSLKSSVKISVKGIATPYDIKLTNKLTGESKEWKSLSSDNIYVGYVAAGINNVDEYDVLFDENSKTTSLLNSEYSLLIIDADGNESETIFNMNAKTLMFDAEGKKFNQTNNVIESQFFKTVGGVTVPDYPRIADHSDGVSTAEWNRNLGGVVVISNLRDGNGQELNSFTVSVKPVGAAIGSGYMPLIVEVLNDGATITKNGHGWITAINSPRGPMMFGVPKGGVSYQIDVTQLCYSNTDRTWHNTNNRMTLLVKVDEPTPYKMYVNNVDYDVIKDFKSAWKMSGNSSDSNPQLEFDGSAVKGWLRFAEEKPNSDIVAGATDTKVKVRLIYNSNQVYVVNLPFKQTEEITYYFEDDCKANSSSGLSSDTYRNSEKIFNWVGDPKMTLDYYSFGKVVNDYNNASAAEKPEYAAQMESIATTVINLRRQLINNLKSGFWLSCPTTGGVLSVKVTSDDLPYEAKILYRSEIVDFDTDTYAAEFSDKFTVTDDGTVVITDINIPTITSKSTSANISSINEGSVSATRTYITPNNKKDQFKYKSPYFVAVVNAKGKTIPENARTVTNSDGYTFRGKTSGFFPVHFIDKLVKYKFIIWSPIDGMLRINKTPLTMNGFCMGYMRNGVRPFATCAIGNNAVVFDNLNAETALPTYRLMNGVSGGKANLTADGTYKCTGVVNATGLSSSSKLQYTTVKRERKNLVIIDNNDCRITELVNGMSKVSDVSGDVTIETGVKLFGLTFVSEKTVHSNINTQGNDNSKVLAVSAPASGGNGTTTYYIYKTSATCKYPLDDVEEKDLSCEVVMVGTTPTYVKCRMQETDFEIPVSESGTFTVQGAACTFSIDYSKVSVLYPDKNDSVDVNVNNVGGKLTFVIKIKSLNVDGGLMAFDADLAGKIYKDAESWVANEDSTSESDQWIATKGYGNSGIFVFKKTGDYFVIAEAVSGKEETGDVCYTRTLSPIYCFREGTVTSADVCNCITKKYLKVTITVSATTNSPYLKHYMAGFAVKQIIGGTEMGYLVNATEDYDKTYPMFISSQGNATGSTPAPTNPSYGSYYSVTSDGNVFGKACSAGDVIVYNGEEWKVYEGISTKVSVGSYFIPLTDAEYNNLKPVTTPSEEVGTPPTTTRQKVSVSYKDYVGIKTVDIEKEVREL